MTAENGAIQDQPPLKAARRSPLAWAIDNADQCALWSFIVGFGLCFAAILLKVHTVDFDGRLVTGKSVELMPRVAGPDSPPVVKQVGYLLALNWSLFGVIIVPCLTWFGLRMMAAMDHLLDQAAHSGVLRDETFERIAASEVVEAWRGHKRMNRLIFTVMFVLVMTFMLSDWWEVVAKPLLWPELITARFDDQTMEFDWSVAAIFADAQVGKWPLFAFTLVAYVLLAGFAPAFAFSLVISAFHFVSFIRGTGAKRRWRLVAMPSRDTDDTHLGFDCFGPFFNMLLLSGLCVLVGLEFMVLQNAYLRDPAANIVEFLLAGPQELQKVGIGELAGWLFEPTRVQAGNPQTGFSYMLFPFVCVIGIGATWGILRNAAMGAQRFSSKHTAALATETGMSETEIEKSLDRMEFWPVGWVKLNNLILIMLLLLFSLVSYRLLFIPLALLGWFVADKLLDLFKTSRRRADS